LAPSHSDNLTHGDGHRDVEVPELGVDSERVLEDKYGQVLDDRHGQQEADLLKAEEAFQKDLEPLL
jgi:hypothetical protein